LEMRPRFIMKSCQGASKGEGGRKGERQGEEKRQGERGDHGDLRKGAYVSVSRSHVEGLSLVPVLGLYIRPLLYQRIHKACLYPQQIWRHVNRQEGVSGGFDDFWTQGRERARESGMPRRLARQWLLTSPLAAASRSIFPALYEPALVDPDGKLLAAFPPPRIRRRSGASTLEHGASPLRMNTHLPAFAITASCNVLNRGCVPRRKPATEASA
jgi:hypothetical protein